MKLISIFLKTNVIFSLSLLRSSWAAGIGLWIFAHAFYILRDFKQFRVDNMSAITTDCPNSDEGNVCLMPVSALDSFGTYVQRMANVCAHYRLFQAIGNLP